MCAAVESAVQPQILEKDVEKANIATANSCNALAPAGEQQSEATHGASEPSSDISQSEGRTDEALAVQEQPLKSNSNDQNHLGAPPSNPAGVEASASPVPSPPRVQSSITVSDTRRPRASAEALPQSGDGEAVCTTQQLADAKQREQTLQRTIRLLEKELANFRRIRPLVVEVPRCVKHPEGFIVYEIDRRCAGLLVLGTGREGMCVLAAAGPRRGLPTQLDAAAAARRCKALDPSVGAVGKNNRRTSRLWGARSPARAAQRTGRARRTRSTRIYSSSARTRCVAGG